MSLERGCVLFSKSARPGRVKTRLYPVLTPGQAAELHQAFLDDLLPRLSVGDFELRVAWGLDDGEALPESGVSAFRQRGDDLGERLYHGLTEVAADHALVVAVGSDHPELTAATVELAFGRLEDGAEVVVGPAEDGGYYLIGVHRDRLSQHLFRGIEWGSARVLQATLERCRTLGLEVGLLPQGRDVDLPEDLERLVTLLRAGTGHCPNTERLLRRWGRLS